MICFYDCVATAQKIKIQNQTPWSETYLREIILEGMKKARIFLVPFDVTKDIAMAAKNGIDIAPSEVRDRLDLPFDSCWVEFPGDDYYSLEVNQNGRELCAFGSLTYELPGGVYLSATFHFWRPVQTLDDYFINVGFLSPEKAKIWQYQWAFWNRVNAPSQTIWGEEMNTGRKIKIGSGNSKAFVKISNAVRVARKGAVLPEKGERHPIEWSHHWEVRGHWRRIAPDIMGKNRTGERNTPGATWVSAYTKGDREQALTRKVRVIETPSDLASESTIPPSN